MRISNFEPAFTTSYWSATRHPGPSLLFLAPLLLVYEIGVLSLGGAQPLSLRNGADTWTRSGLEALSIRHTAAAPLLVLIVVGGWYMARRETTPENSPVLCLGMVLESVVVALGLWVLSRAFNPLLAYLGITVSMPPLLNFPAFGQVVTYIGAGIYEEVMFRLILFGGLVLLFKAVRMPGAIAVVAAAIVAALLFAAAHHIGPNGEPVDGYNFLFRTVAGLYFTAIYQLRGVGIAVGAHACYDVLVGIAM